MTRLDALNDIKNIEESVSELEYILFHDLLAFYNIDIEETNSSVYDILTKKLRMSPMEVKTLLNYINKLETYTTLVGNRLRDVQKQLNNQ